MPKINHVVPNFRKIHDVNGYEIDGYANKVPHEKTKPDPFTMTRKEESMAKSGSIPKLMPSDAHLKFKPEVDYRKSLNNF